MGISAEVALSAANAYTEETVIGGGAIKGKNCTISSITEITGGHRVTFQWTLDDGTVKTETMDVIDGTSDYSELTNKPGINGVTLSGNKTTADLGISYDDLTDKPTIPSISDCYQTTDLAGTGLEDEDLIPYYNESASGKSNVTFSNMKSTLKSYFDNVYAKPLSYSKSEQDTGLTWIDGKPIYQRTIDCDLSELTPATARTAYLIADFSASKLDIPVDIVVDCNALVIPDSTNPACYPGQCVQNTTTDTISSKTVVTGVTYYFIWGQRSGVGCVAAGYNSYFYQALNNANGKVIVTIRYTKTTD